MKAEVGACQIYLRSIADEMEKKRETHQGETSKRNRSPVKRLKGKYNFQMEQSLYYDQKMSKDVEYDEHKSRPTSPRLNRHT